MIGSTGQRTAIWRRPAGFTFYLIWEETAKDILLQSTGKRGKKDDKKMGISL
jgi:hypothetical protein